MRRNTTGIGGRQTDRTGMGSVECGEIHIQPAKDGGGTIGPFPTESVILASGAAGVMYLATRD